MKFRTTPASGILQQADAVSQEAPQAGAEGNRRSEGGGGHRPARRLTCDAIPHRVDPAGVYWTAFNDGRQDSCNVYAGSENTSLSC